MIQLNDFESMVEMSKRVDYIKMKDGAKKEFIERLKENVGTHCKTIMSCVESIKNQLQQTKVKLEQINQKVSNTQSSDDDATKD